MKYYFHFTKGIKQGYVMEDENKKTIYEAKMQKLTFFKPYDFEFSNLLTNEKKIYKVSHKVQKQVGFGTGQNSKFVFTTDSHIKINGINNWELLEKEGYSMNYSMDGLKPCYTLYQNDKEIAYVKTTGADVYEEKNSLLSKLPVNGNFVIEGKEKDIDIIFMFCFMIARAVMLESE